MLEGHFNEQQQHPSGINIFIRTLAGLPQKGRAHKHKLQYRSLSEIQTANVKKRQFLKKIKSPQYGIQTKEVAREERKSFSSSKET